MNGVSGYDPPHYQPLQVGLRAADPEMLAAIASAGLYESASSRPTIAMASAALRR